MGTKVINGFAENGGQYVNDTNQVTPTVPQKIFAIQVVDSCTFSQIDGNITGAGLLTDTFLTGTIIYGKFNSFTLATGKVLAYEG